MTNKQETQQEGIKSEIQEKKKLRIVSEKIEEAQSEKQALFVQINTLEGQKKALESEIFRLQNKKSLLLDSISDLEDKKSRKELSLDALHEDEKLLKKGNLSTARKLLNK